MQNSIFPEGYKLPQQTAENLKDDILDIDPYDINHPRSMINKVPNWLRERMQGQLMMEYMRMDEEKLQEIVKPTLTINRLRTAFWYEYEKLFAKYGSSYNSHSDHGLSIHRVCSGICSVSYFMYDVARNDAYLAWISHPPLNYEKSMQEALTHGLDRVREILNLPMLEYKFTKDGLPCVDPCTNQPVMIANEKVANIILKTVAFIDLRIKGAIPQQIQQNINRNSINYNVRDANSRVTVDVEALDSKLLTIEDLDSKIKELSNETNDLINDPKYDKSETMYLRKEQEAGLKAHAIENKLHPQHPVPEINKKDLIQQ